eukprot:m.143135 g.143135  ORF g.143135 m.143135 type:complete len:548 (-) comp9660_c0_seq2:161-1804(-)
MPRHALPVRPSWPGHEDAGLNVITSPADRSGKKTDGPPAMMASVTVVSALKTQELFLRWLSLPDVQTAIQADATALAKHRWSASETSFAVPKPARPFSPDSPPMSRQARNRRKSLETGESNPVPRTDAPRQPRKRIFSFVSGSEVPRFFFPHGKADKIPYSPAAIELAFEDVGTPCLLEDFQTVVKACGLPRYWAGIVFSAAGGTTNRGLARADFLPFWEQLVRTYHDPVSKFIQLCNPGATALRREHLRPLVSYVIDIHPSLDFLRAAPEFHARYIDTVLARIFYTVNRSWSGQITHSELSRSNFLAVLQSLEDLTDINMAADYFSYEHFYVIYTSFWKLDADHDLRISRAELGRYGDDGLSSLALDRIFAGTVAKATSPADKMTYDEFVWFILAEEDKNHPTAAEYWFRVLDIDGDGVVSMHELHTFYEEQCARLAALGVDSLAFRDCMCVAIDMVSPKNRHAISLADIKRSRQAPLFFNTFCNVNKFLDVEEKDPFQAQKENQAQKDAKETDWQKFARLQYAVLAREEDAADDSSSASESDLWD